MESTTGSLNVAKRPPTSPIFQNTRHHNPLNRTRWMPSELSAKGSPTAKTRFDEPPAGGIGDKQAMAVPNQLKPSPPCRCSGSTFLIPSTDLRFVACPFPPLSAEGNGTESNKATECYQQGPATITQSSRARGVPLRC